MRESVLGSSELALRRHAPKLHESEHGCGDADEAARNERPIGAYVHEHQPACEREDRARCDRDDERDPYEECGLLHASLSFDRPRTDDERGAMSPGQWKASNGSCRIRGEASPAEKGKSARTTRKTAAGPSGPHV